MIISHKHKFIFIHSRKAAGSTVKVALSPSLGDDDIVIGSANEILASGNSLPRRAYQDAQSVKGAFYLLAALIAGKGKHRALNVCIKSRYTQTLGRNPAHPPAAVIADAFPYEWKEYYKFAIVRDPHERLVSDFFWRQRATKRRNVRFLDYLNDVVDGTNRTGLVHTEGTKNWDMITIGDEVAVDGIARFENLAADLERITQNIGVPNLDLSRKMKVGGAKDFRGMYGEAELSAMRRGFSKEIETFGYRFE